MTKKLQKSLQGYISKLRKPSQNIHFFPSNYLSSSKEWVLSGCKHPKTLSFAVDRNAVQDHECKDGEAARLSDVDRFLFENFRSLYIRDDDEEHHDQNNMKKKVDSDSDHDHDRDYQVLSPGKVLFGSPRFHHPPPDVCGSHRFFVAAGTTGSLVEEAARLSSTATSEDNIDSTTTTTTTGSDEAHPKCISLPDDSIAVLMYSTTPYEGFRQSMEEMVEARVGHVGKVDWDFMEEMLFCYLELNEKKLHSFILNAFVDLVVGLRQRSGEAPRDHRVILDLQDQIIEECVA